jgi:glycosyltransferase involved in cell wall biosynthesis
MPSRPSSAWSQRRPLKLAGVLKVSVVVPVYNPGSHLHRCLDSLIGQTLPPVDYEVIFVDDGSTDGTGARLDEAAMRHSQLRVLHQPNSGWPGQPRNRGLDAARGEYVFFCDDDDWLAADALEVLHRFAIDNGSDIVLGKMGGVGRRVPRVLFTRTRPAATLQDTPLMDSLTVHKLFRRAFLVETGIRFAEGRRRLEDHLFMAQAYLEAGTISVYAGHTCYFHVRQPTNASAQQPHWPSYFADLEEAVEAVERRTEPGPFRDRLLSRWLRVEMVDRLSGRALEKRSPYEVANLFQAAHEVARRHFGDGVVARLSAADRPLGRAILAGDLPVVWERAAQLACWRVEARILQIGWYDGSLQLCGTIELVAPGIGPADGPNALAALLPDLEPAELAAALAASSPIPELENPATGERFAPAARIRGAGLARSFTMDLDPGVLPRSETPTSTWDFHAQFRALGVGRRTPMLLVDERTLTRPLRPSGSAARRAAVTSGDGGRVRLTVGPTVRRRMAQGRHRFAG